MIKLIRFFNTLNFDTAFGAASFVLVVSYSQQVKISLFVYLALIISVLIIYNVDHLLDAQKLKSTTKSYRHGFYQKYFKLLIFWQIILMATGLYVVFYLPVQVFWTGVIMVGIIGVYFLIIFKSSSKNYFLREVMVAIGYTFAVAVIPFMHTNLHLRLSYYELLTLIFFIALSNLWVFAIYDTEVDANQGHHSITRAINITKLSRLVRLIIMFTCLLIVLYFIYYKLWLLGASLFIVEAIYFLLLEKQFYFKNNEYYRLLGELVLVLPGVLILLQYAI